MAVHVTNSCPVDVWVHGVGSEGALQPDNAHLSPGAARDYNAPATWTAARIYAYLQAPDGSGNPQGQNDKVEMNFFQVNGVETINTDITYVDWLALPARIEAIGSGSDCTTVGCELPYSQILSGCPGLAAERPPSACRREPTSPRSDAQRRSDVPRPRRQGSQRAPPSTPGCAGAAGSSTAQVYSLARAASSATSPQFCAALNRGVLASPGPNTPASSFYQSPPYNPYSAWVHGRCPGIYAFPYDDYGASNQSSDHTCGGATRLNITFCPQG